MCDFIISYLIEKGMNLYGKKNKTPITTFGRGKMEEELRNQKISDLVKKIPVDL